MSKFQNIKFDEKSQGTLKIIKNHFKSIEKVIEEDLPPGAERDQALASLQEADHWVEKSVKAEQISRLGEHIDDFERGTATPKESAATAPKS